jgi:hypothetical protein
MSQIAEDRREWTKGDEEINGVNGREGRRKEVHVKSVEEWTKSMKTAGESGESTRAAKAWQINI